MYTPINGPMNTYYMTGPVESTAQNQNDYDPHYIGTYVLASEMSYTAFFWAKPLDQREIKTLLGFTIL